MTRIYKTTFRLRRGDAEEWAQVNPILYAGEPAFEVDTLRLKIGNGTEHYNDLPYITGSAAESIIVNRPTHYDFPSVGNTNAIYKAEKERQLYQWDPEELRYVPLGSYGEVSLINGGNASGINNP